MIPFLNAMFTAVFYVYFLGSPGQKHGFQSTFLRIQVPKMYILCNHKLSGIKFNDVLTEVFV